MTISVRMDPLLEKELEMAAKRHGVTKSQFVIDAVERALGHKDPFQLLHLVREEFAPYHLAQGASLPESVAEAVSPATQKLRSSLKAKHKAELADWEAYQAAKLKGQDWTPS